MLSLWWQNIKLSEVFRFVHKCLLVWHAYDDKSLCMRTIFRLRDHCQKRRHRSWASRILSWKLSFYRIRGLVNNINISNMVAVSLLQVNKWRWGKLSQILQSKLSAPKYCEFSDENCEQLYVVFHCQYDLKTQKNM